MISDVRAARRQRPLHAGPGDQGRRSLAIVHAGQDQVNGVRQQRAVLRAGTRCIELVQKRTWRGHAWA
jgi:hypothetical protein